MKTLPVRRTQCPTCPFRDGSQYADLRGMLSMSALSQASRICHSTGSNNAINRRTGKPPKLCRGARDLQLQFFHRIGFLDEPTDKCWAAKWREIQKGLR
jgi:hypothetical protein